MELIFNELSSPVNCANKYEANDNMIKFAEAVNTASKHGFKNVRSNLFVNQIMLFEDYSVHSWLVDKDASKDHKDFLFGKFVSPFINEEDVEIEEQYIDANYYFESAEDNINRVECFGLASAHLYETLSVSFSSLPIWDRTRHSIVISKDNQETIVDVLNVSSKESFEDEEITNHIQNTKTLELILTDTLPDNKLLNITGDHHGNKEREMLWHKIKNSPYVISMISTGGYGTDRFIRNITKDGIVEAVIDGKYSIRIQTTGRNYRETKAIADILEEEYS